MTTAKAIANLKGFSFNGDDAVIALIQRQAARIAALEEAVRLYEEADKFLCCCDDPDDAAESRCDHCDTWIKARAAAEKGKL